MLRHPIRHGRKVLPSNHWKTRLTDAPLRIVAVVFICGLVLTERSWRWVEAAETQMARNEFEQASSAVVDQLQARLRTYDQVLRAARALYAVADINRRHWNEFAVRMNLDNQYPGIQALAFTSTVKATDLPRFLAARRSEGAADFKVFPSGARPDYQLATYVFPETPLNLRALGYDLATHGMRREIMGRARETNMTAMSGKIVLVQDDKTGQPGFLLFHPLYRGEGDPPPERRHELSAGFVAAAFRIQDFMLAVLAEESPGAFAVRVSDAAMPFDGEPLMFDSDVNLRRADRLFHYAGALDFGGHVWQLSFDSTPDFEAGIGHDRSRLVLLGGVAGTLLLSLLAWLLADSRAKVLRRAHEMTVDLRASEERFRRLSELSSDWFWELDSEFRFTTLSRGVADKGGLNAKRVLGKHRWDLPIKLSPEQWAAHRALLEAHQPFRDFEFQIESDGKPDELRWVSISGEPLFDGEGRFTGYSGVGKNITERRHAEEELKRHRNHLQEMVAEQTADLLKAKRAAEHANQAKSEFLANMSHELPTPMHAILSFARIGVDKAETVSIGKITGYFNRILMSGQRLLVLINSLLDLSKLEAGKMTIDRKPTDLARIIRDALSEFESLSETKFLNMAFLQPTCDTHVSIDTQRVGQVVRNLLSNAIKFSPAESCVEIVIDSDELPGGRRAQDQGVVSALRLRIVDAGIGIPEDELLTIFDKFTQSDATRTGAGGTGLGLAICKEVVIAHRGSIRAYNNTCGGATFEVLLPRGE